jgi:hypothetical protein
MRYSLLGTLLCMALITTLASADDFSDFRIPRHSLFNGTLGLSFDGSRQGSHVGLSSDLNKQLTGRMNAYLDWWMDSDELQRELSFSLSPYYRYYQYAGTYPSGSLGAKSKHDQKNHDWQEAGTLSAALRKYPVVSPWALELGASLKCNFSQSRYQYESENDNPDAYEIKYIQYEKSWGYDYYASLSAGIGYGRVRDATAIYTVQVLEDRLTATGALKNPLTKTAREKLAALFYNQGMYASIHDRSGKFFWKDVEQVLRDEGALSNTTLDAYSLYRADENTIPSEINGRTYSLVKGFTRYSGYWAGLTVQGNHDHYINRDWTNHYNILHSTPDQHSDEVTRFIRYDYWTDHIWMGVRGEYHKPLGMRWQVDGSGSLLFPTDRMSKSMQLSTDVSLVYQISDRFQFNVYGNQNRDLEKSGTRYGVKYLDNWSVNLGAGIYYYIEDNLRAGLSYTNSQQRLFPQSSSSSNDGRYYESDDYFTVGLSYHFLGRGEIQGKSEPIHLMQMP